MSDEDERIWIEELKTRELGQALRDHVADAVRVAVAAERARCVAVAEAFARRCRDRCDSVGWSVADAIAGTVLLGKESPEPTSPGADHPLPGHQPDLGGES